MIRLHPVVLSAERGAACDYNNYNSIHFFQLLCHVFLREQALKYSYPSDLMDRLHCERTTVYKLRARAVSRLNRLYYEVEE